MDNFTIEVTESTYKTAKEARNAKCIPIIYYGKGTDPIKFFADYQDFRRTYDKAGKSSIITLKNEKNQEFPALVHQIQYDPVSDSMIHADLMTVDMKKTITTEIPLLFTGQSAAVKELDGILMQNKDRIKVECLPSDLVNKIEVDISSLIDFHSAITVGDIKAPNGITITDAKDINIATVSAPRKEEEEEVQTEEDTEDTEDTEGDSDEKKESDSDEKQEDDK